MTRIWLADAAGRYEPDALASQLGSTGAQGSVWQLRGRPDMVAKVLHRVDTVDLAVRLKAMLTEPTDWTVRADRVVVAWPTATVHGWEDRRLIGYAAPRLGLPRYAPLPLLLNPLERTRLLPTCTWEWWLTYAEDLARTVHAAHQRGHVIGDLAPVNLFATPDGGAALVDADGWQVHDSGTGADLPCPFSRPEYTAPEMLDATVGPRTVASDRWSLAVLVAQFLCLGFHPFGGVPPDTDGFVEEVDNVRARRSWLLGGVVRTPAGAAPAWCLPQLVRRRFDEAVSDGYDDPDARPEPLAWASVLARSRRELLTCAEQRTHVYAGDISTCPWCAMAKSGGRDPFPGRPASAPTRSTGGKR